MKVTRSRREAQTFSAAAVQRGQRGLALNVLLVLPTESGWKTINYEPELARSLHSNGDGGDDIPARSAGLGLLWQ